VRKPPEARLSASHRRLAVVLLCAFAVLSPFAGCLNPRPEEYPSDNASPGQAATGPADNPNRESVDYDPNAASDQPEPPAAEDLAPGLPDAPRPEPPVPPDAGADAGPSDAGAPALAE
jgi:hypothetical protein